MCSSAIETDGWVRCIMGWQTVGHPQRMLFVVLHQDIFEKYLVTLITQQV